jgi:hypothetical protein
MPDVERVKEELTIEMEVLEFERLCRKFSCGDALR